MFPLRLSDEEIAQAERVRAKRGLRSHADAWRNAMNQDAEALGVAIPKPEPPKPGKPKRVR